MFNRLRVRLTAVCAVSTGLVLMGMAGASLFFSVRELRQQYENAFLSDMNSVFFYLRGQSSVDHTWLARTEAGSGLWIAVTGTGGPLLFNSQLPFRQEITNTAARTALDVYGFDYTKRPQGTLEPDSITFEMDFGGNTYRTVVASVPVGQENWFSVAILKSRAPEQSRIRVLWLTFAGCVAGGLFCLVVFAWVFTSWAIRPVREGHRRQTEFVSAASHELRSPLAVMQASAGAAKTAPIEDARRFAATIEQECGRLARLTEDLLRLAGADSRSWTMNMAAADPQTILLTAGERYETLAGRKDIQVDYRLPEQELPSVRCDALRIEQLLGILLENAIEYTPQGGRITMSASLGRAGVSLSVADSGPGVSDTDKVRIFRRFYRGDKARTEKNHYGLGLSIASVIARLHKGDLAVTNAAKGGAVFTLTLPAGKGLFR